MVPIPDDKRTYLNHPFVGVGAVVWKMNEFLLVRRGKHPRLGEWSIPGGRQNLGETAKQATRREIFEETSIRIKIIGLIDVVDAICRDEHNDVKFHATLIDYAALYISGTPSAGDDALDLNWFALTDLDTLGLWEETEKVIRKSEPIIGGC